MRCPRGRVFTITQFITVAYIERSARYYEKVFGGRILSLGDSKGASGHILIANTWLIIVNVGGLIAETLQKVYMLVRQGIVRHNVTLSHAKNC